MISVTELYNTLPAFEQVSGLFEDRAIEILQRFYAGENEFGLSSSLSSSCHLLGDPDPRSRHSPCIETQDKGSPQDQLR